MKCTNCGAALEGTATFCGYCGTSVSTAPTAAALPVAMALAPAGAAAIAAPLAAPMAAALPTTSDADLPAYYREQFARIDTGGAKAAKFNWAGFLFGPFWYLYRGMWGKALLMFAVAAGSGGALGALAPWYCAFRGNYDLWLLRRQGKQLW